MDHHLSRHVLSQESVHPAPDVTTLTPRAQGVNWPIVARGKVAQLLSSINDSDGKVIPNFVHRIADEQMERVLGKVDLDNIDQHVQWICTAAMRGYRQSADAVVSADTERATYASAFSAAEEILHESVCWPFRLPEGS
ncbi:MAG: hypothetical protein PHX87_03980 [Candidatus Peribacteraceae bacterium]|nr:hypothetical protein [Candidatus Peribacteraceae bacterium]MDD5742562.1 hypothetical protein [Candidatus Peribacteraceae bacterium]